MLDFVVYNVRRRAFLRDRFNDGHNVCYTWTPDERWAKRFEHGHMARCMARKINERYGVVARPVNLLMAECIRRGNEYGEGVQG